MVDRLEKKFAKNHAGDVANNLRGSKHEKIIELITNARKFAEMSGINKTVVTELSKEDKADLGIKSNIVEDYFINEINARIKISETPTPAPTAEPTGALLTIAPSAEPTMVPVTAAPTSVNVTVIPSAESTFAPTAMPTIAPTAEPTFAPTEVPTVAPTAEPIFAPTEVQTIAPTVEATFGNTFNVSFGGNTTDDIHVGGGGL